MATIAELRRALRAVALRFVEEVLEVAAAHASALAPAATASDSGPRAPRKRVRRRAESLRAIGVAVRAAIPARGAIGIGALARAIGRTPSELARPIAILLAEGRIAKSGERRGTQYFLPRPSLPPPPPPKKRGRTGRDSPRT